MKTDMKTDMKTGTKTNTEIGKDLNRTCPSDKEQTRREDRNWDNARDITGTGAQTHPD